MIYSHRPPVVITDVPSSMIWTCRRCFLNLAWDIVLDLVSEVHQAQMEEWDSDGSVTDEYWTVAQRQLAHVSILVATGSEFLLKSRISALVHFSCWMVSPKDWPRGSITATPAFSLFKTIDAQKLVRAHDTVSDLGCRANSSSDTTTAPSS